VNAVIEASTVADGSAEARVRVSNPFPAITTPRMQSGCSASHNSDEIASARSVRGVLSSSRASMVVVRKQKAKFVELYRLSFFSSTKQNDKYFSYNFFI
jgi:hypothetical protein